MTAETILLVRHGETDWNREGRLQGWGPTPLNERGHEQARRLGTVLAEEYDIDRIISSDSCRTRETTANIRNSTVTAEPTFDAAWRERGLGVYQGFTRAELNERFPAVAVGSGAVALEEKPEGGESFGEIYSRIQTAWETLCTDADGETVLVVTHGGPITIVLAALRAEDLMTAVERYTIGNCSVTEISLPAKDVHRENDRLFDAVPPR